MLGARYYFDLHRGQPSLQETQTLGSGSREIHHPADDVRAAVIHPY
jgi:hypothetical protein